MHFPYYIGPWLSGPWGWLRALVLAAVVGGVLWGLNAYWLSRLKKGKADFSPAGNRKKARRFCIGFAAGLAVFVLAVLLWDLH